MTGDSLKKACFLLAGSLLALASSPALAIRSNSGNFSNTRSGIDSAGGTMVSFNYHSDSNLGEIAATSHTSVNFTGRSGLMPIYFYPAQIDDFSVTSCRSSALFLSWTAPGNDGKAPGTAAKAYLIKVSSNPAMSPAASETLFYAAQDATASPPAPGVRGSTQSVQVSGLTDGVTYYFAIIALETDGDPGPLSPGATTNAGGIGPPLAGFYGVSGFKRALLYWAAAAGVPGYCTPVSYRLYRSSEVPQNYAAILDTTSTNHSDSAVTVGNTYYYELVGLNSSSIEITSPALTQVWVRAAPPTPPLRLALTVNVSSTTLSWKTPVAYDVGVGFVDPAHTAPDEFKSLTVWKSTSLYDAGWTALATVSTMTSQYADMASAPGTYYRLTASNITDTSYSSIVRSRDSGDGFIIAPDLRTHLYIPKPTLAALDGNPAMAYWVRSSSGMIASGGATQADNTVLNTARFDVYNEGGNPAGGFDFGRPIQVRMGYTTGPNGTVLAQGVTASAASAPSPDQTSLFWFNGMKWVDLYGTLDAADRVMIVQTQAAGAYQLRSVSREAAFSFEAGGLSSKFFTPNGDGLNDKVQFRFNNPKQSSITGRILDLKGAVVASMAQTSVNTMEWDGMSGGRPVGGGVYIYQLEGDGQVFNGTVVVIK